MKIKDKGPSLQLSPKVSRVFAGLLMGFCLQLLFAYFLLPIAGWRYFAAMMWPEVVYRGDVGGDAIGLTIDDGPDPHSTPKTLDLLDKYGATATFFCIGSKAERHPNLIQEILRRGHGVANHMYYDRPSWRLDEEMFRDHLLRTEQALKLGGGPKYFRPGSGIFNRGMLQALLETGYTPVLGSRYAFDPQLSWAGGVARLLSHRLSGGDIVIIHEGISGRESSMEALRSLLIEAQRRHLRAVRLSELFLL